MTTRQDLPGCIDHEQIETPTGIVYRWPNPDHAGRWIETRDPLLVPLNLEAKARLSAAYEAHAVACSEAGWDVNRSTSPREGYDPARAIYRKAFDREMVSHGYPAEA